MVLCVVIMFFGIVGCPVNDQQVSTLGTESFALNPVTTTDTGSAPINESSPVPEITTLVLLGSGLVDLSGFGRKSFKK